MPLDRRSVTEMSLGHNVVSKQEVLAVMAQAQAAGASIVKPAQNTYWGGYADYFQKPEAPFGEWFGIRKCSRMSKADAANAECVL